MKKKIITFVGLTLLVGGLVIGSRPLINWWHQRNDLSKYGPAVIHKVDSSATKTNQLITGQPQLLEIPSLNISVPVIEGHYNSQKKTWSTSLDKAHYATNMPAPNNQGGNTFIYGHNRWEVFNRLPKIPVDAEAVVTTTNKHKFTYKLSNVKTTNPNDTSLFSYKGSPILTLQTCTGLWYQDRTLFTFQLVEVS